MYIDIILHNYENACIKIKVYNAGYEQCWRSLLPSTIALQDFEREPWQQTINGLMCVTVQWDIPL